jgi:cystathionine gamma-synthase/cystathionine gamma-lyase
VLSVLKSGDHVVSGNDIYGGTYRLFEKVFKQWGLEVTYADAGKKDSFEKAVRKNTKLIWIETPTNPLLKIIDIRHLAGVAKKKNILLAVDNTFASPYFQRPLELGADVVVHSTTKYVAGHSDVIGGAVITSNERLYGDVKYYQNAAGAVPGTWDSWLVLRGIKTLAIRMREHEKNALFLARFLERSNKIENVYYPGLKSHKGYETAKRQMDGFGGMISIEVKGGRQEAKKFISGLKIFTLAESLGGVESLVCYPAEMTHASIPLKERLQRGIKDNLIRLSVGIEHKDDLLADLEKALKNII